MNSFETLDKEVKDLLENYKLKKTSVYEPCTIQNFKECLIGLREELGFLNISYIFNPYLDIVDGNLTSESLVTLINAAYTVLYHYKTLNEKIEMLTEQNHILENNNNHLNSRIKILKEKLNEEKNEAQACVITAQRISDQSEKISSQLNNSRKEVIKIKKQKETQEKSLKNEVLRLRLENEKLRDQLRGKIGPHTSCSEICDSTLIQIEAREEKQKAVITQLQLHNHELLREILAMKEELLLNSSDLIEH